MWCNTLGHSTSAIKVWACLILSDISQMELGQQLIPVDFQDRHEGSWPQGKAGPVSSKPGVQSWSFLVQMPMLPHTVEMMEKNLLGTGHGEFRLLSM